MRINSEKIIAECKRLGLTKTALAKHLGISRTRLYKILEAGPEIKLSTINRLAGVLQIDAKDLVK